MLRGHHVDLILEKFGELKATPTPELLAQCRKERLLCVGRVSLSLTHTPVLVIREAQSSSELILISVHPHVAAKELSLESHKCSDSYSL